MGNKPVTVALLCALASVGTGCNKDSRDGADKSSDKKAAAKPEKAVAKPEKAASPQEALNRLEAACKSLDAEALADALHAPSVKALRGELEARAAVGKAWAEMDRVLTAKYGMGFPETGEYTGFNLLFELMQAVGIFGRGFVAVETSGWKSVGEDRKEFQAVVVRKPESDDPKAELRRGPPIPLLAIRGDDGWKIASERMLDDIPGCEAQTKSHQRMLEKVLAFTGYAKDGLYPELSDFRVAFLADIRPGRMPPADLKTNN